MTTPTPGPWRVNSAGPARIIYDSTPEGWAVADVKTFHGRHPEGQSEANARLIAAAPELLDALIAAKQEMWLVARHQWTMADFKNWAIIQRIDSVLEKADGKMRSGKVEAQP